MKTETAALILTIDDEAGIRSSFRNYLEDFDYCVVEAENGRQGLELFHSANPDLVLVDLRMPEVDGLEVLEEVHRAKPETPIIVVSGTGVIADVVEALRKGAWDYLLKPIEDLSVLHHAVEKALERAKLLSENKAYQQRLEQLVDARTQQLRQAHEELRQSHLDLKQSEAKYRLLFETMLHGFAFHEPIYDDNQVLVDCRFLETNPAQEVIFQRPTEQIVNQRLCQLLPQSGREWIEACRQSVQAGKATRTEVYIPEIEKHLDILAFDPGTGQMVTMMSDITDRKRLENQLLQAQKMEAIGTLAGGIAHDFNNILGGILGYAELAKMQLNDKGEAAHKIDQVLSSGARAKDLVQRILSFSREQEFERKPIQARAIVEEVLKLIRAALPTTIEIRKEIRANRDTILADPTQVHQILMNLCTNAHHAMREKGGSLTVALDNESLDAEQIKERQLHLSPGEYLKMTVADTGMGIPAHLIHQIFDPYFTTKKRGEGTGLGLAVVMGIATAHGGSANVISERGKGTCFEVYLPLTRSDTQRDRPQTAQMRTDKGRERVLFVDDEEILVEIGSEMLRTLGYTVTALTDPVEAWECFEADPQGFDLLVTDLTMPGITGDQLAEKVVGLRPEFPVIITTGNSAEMSAMISKSVHIRGYIPKPMVLGELARSVRQALDQD
ncbi:MAG: response regulator [Desulfosarcinaceae bacterium]|nr:response regulator [Desulfosarcinaceae bacterium]